jgi:hypothetical protein
MRPAGQMMPTLVHPNNNAATLAAPAGLALNGALKINPRQNTVTTYNPTTGMRTTNGTGPGILQQAVLPNGGINGGATTTTRTVILPNGNPVTLVQQQAPTNQQNQQQAANLLQLRQQQALSELRARMAVVAAQQQQQAGVQRVTTANGQVLNVRLINADGTPVATSNGQQVLDLSQLLNQARPDALQQAKKAAAAQQQLLQQQQQQQPQQQQVLRIGNQQVVLLPNTRLGAGHNNMAAVHLLQQQQQLGEQQAQRTAQFARQLSNPVMANNTIDRPGAAHPDFLLANGSMEGVPMQLGSKSLSLSAELARVAPDHNMQHHAFSTLTSPGTPAPLASPTGLSDHNGSLANTDLSIKGALGLNGSAVTGNGGPEDLRVILSSIGQELARHGISVDAAVGAGWLGALSPGDVALLREVHATETRRLLMQPQAALNSAQLSPSADSNATDAALLSSGGTVSSNNSDGTSTLRSNGTGPGQEGTGHTMNGPSGATAHDPAGLDLSIDEMMAMMGAGGQGDAPFSAFSYGFFADVLDSSDGPPGGRLLEPLEPAATENGNAAAGGHALGDLVYRSFDAKVGRDAIWWLPLARSALQRSPPSAHAEGGDRRLLRGMPACGCVQAAWLLVTVLFCTCLTTLPVFVRAPCPAVCGII